MVSTFQSARNRRWEQSMSMSSPECSIGWRELMGFEIELDG
jgi:hypothetical protein